MSYLLQSKNSEQIKNENLYLKSLEIKTGESINLVSYRTANDQIPENINSNSNKTINSDYKLDPKKKKSNDLSYKFSISSSNKDDSNSKLRINNIGINKSELTIEEDLILNNKSNTSKKHLYLQQKSILSNNSNIPEDIHSVKKQIPTENNYDDYGQFDYDYENSSKSKQNYNSFNIEEDDIEEEIILKK